MHDVVNWAVVVVVAALASFLGAAVTTRIGSLGRVVDGRTVGVAGAVAGSLIGQAVLRVWPHLPPANALDRFLTFGMPAAVILTWTHGPPGRPSPTRVFLHVTFGATLVWILLLGSVYLQGSTTQVGLLVAAWAGLLVAVQALATRLWRGTRTAAIPLAFAAALLTSGLLVVLGGYLTGGTLAVPWAAALIGAIVGGRRSGSRVDLQGVTELAAIALFGLTFIGRFFGGLSTGSGLLVLTAPFLCWLAELPVIRTLGPWKKECLRFSVVTAILLALLISAKRVFDRDMAPFLRMTGGDPSTERAPLAYVRNASPPNRQVRQNGSAAATCRSSCGL